MSQLQFADDPLEEEQGPAGHPVAEVLEVLLRRRWLILACVACALLVTGIVSWSSRPMYRATTLLNLDRERANPLDFSSGPARDLTLDAESLATEMELMKSRDVAERVSMRRRRETSNGTAESAVPDSTPASREAITAEALRIKRNIEAIPVRGTNLIQLSYVAPDPKQAAELANAVAEAFIDWKLESKFRLLGQASKFLASQIDDAKQALAEKEQRLLTLGRQKDILAIAPQSSVTLQKLTALSQDASQAMADRITKEARYNELQSSTSATLPDSLSTGAMYQIRSELARLEREYSEKRGIYKPEWPAMQALKAQIEKTQQSLEAATRDSLTKAREQAKAEYQTALRREESLRDALQRQRGEAMTVSKDAVEYNNLRIEAETQRALVDNLLKREAEMQVLLRLQGEKLSSVRIVESALPPHAPFTPSYLRNFIAGLLAGLFGGVGLALLLDSLDRSLHSAGQVMQHLRLPVLGVIPPAQAVLDRRYGYGYGLAESAQGAKTPKPLDARPKKTVSIELLPHDLPQSTVAEAYRSFRTSLLLSRADGVKSLVVTSALPLEGKTSTATNLAIVLGQLGRRVLLVDADLRRPHIHEILNVSNRIGLVSVLAAHTDPGDAILPTQLPNVSVLPAGPLAPDPSGLIHSEAMKRFLSTVTGAFDHVVFDSPPVLAVTDGVLLSSLTDGAILCVRGAATSREKVARARDELLRGRVSILGVLLNSLRDETRTGTAAPAYSRPEQEAPQPADSTARPATAAS